MGIYVLKRVAFIIPMMIASSFLVFSLMELVPGDAAITLAGDSPTPERVEAIRQELGLDKPFFERYGSWIGNALQGDLGSSLYRSFTVVGEITGRLPATISLTGLAMLFAVGVGVPAGALASLRPNSLLDRGITFVASLGLAVPYFWAGMIFVSIFALQLGWLPAVGFVALTEDPVEWFRHLVIPAVALGMAPAAGLARQTRSSMAAVLRQDYIRTAEAKGVPPWRVIVKHTLKNAAIPVVTVIGSDLGRLLGGTVVVERLFGLPGVGNLAYEAVFSRDLPVVQGVVLVTALGVLVINLLVDISYGYFNPRVRS